MTTCKQNVNSFSGCNCSSIYYQNPPTIDYTKILTITSVPYNSKVTTESNQGLLPLANNKFVNFIKCSLYNEDSNTSYANFLLNNILSGADGNNTAPSDLSVSKMKLRCLEDIWISPLGNAFSIDSQNFVYDFIRLQNTDYSLLWNKIINKINTVWVYGSNNAVFPSDRREAIWWWILPNISGYSDPIDLTKKRLSNITTGGFPYKMYSYDSLEFSSYCPLFTFYSQNFGHYYSISQGNDNTIANTLGNNWWIRYIPEASPGSIYIKWPAFISGQGSSLEALLKFNFPAFYTSMIQAPVDSKTFSKPTWIMRIGLEYIKRTNGFLSYPDYMKTTLEKIYNQYIDIKTRLCYMTLYQILQARYFGDSVINSSTDVSENPNNVIYLCQYSSSVGNLSYSLKSNRPILSDGIDPNSLLEDSGYPHTTVQNLLITTAFTGFELGVYYTSNIRSSSSLIFSNPSMNVNLFGSLMIYTKGSGYATSVSDSTNLKTLIQLFGVNGEGISYNRPVPRVNRVLNPFDATDPYIVTPPKNTNTVFSYITYNIMLYILIAIIIIIVIIAIIIYLIKRKNYPPDISNSYIPEIYRSGKYGHLIYDEI